MPPKRILYESNHPVDKYPFEILCSGSWHAVEFIRIKNGAMTIHMADDQCVIESRSFANLRVRSRPATISDCTCFLRPGIDVCFLSSLQHVEGSDLERKEPVWVDAKISSIKRKPHDSECSCQFFIKSYIHQGSLGERVVLRKETEEVQLHQIAILQRLEKSPCGDQYYRWGSSDDCTTLYRTKLCLGKFCSDISWLLVTSVLKRISFDVRSVHNKIVYQILSLDDKTPLESNRLLHALNFGVGNDLSESNVFQFESVQTYGAGATCSTNENVDVPYSILNLRRSKRRNVQPDRFLGCEHISDSEIGAIRLLPYKTNRCNDEEDMSVPLSCLFGMDGNESYSEIWSPEETGDPDWEDGIKPKVSGATPSKPKATIGELKKRQNKLFVVHASLESHPSDDEELNYPKFPGTNSEDNRLQMKFSFGGGRSLPKKLKDPELDDYDSTWNNKFSWKPTVTSQKKKVERRSYFYYSRPKRNFNDEPSSYRKNTLSAGAYNKVINSYMKKIDSTMGKEEPNIIDQWNQFKAKTSSEKGRRMNKTPVLEDDEPSELDLLWREMELCLASSFFEENEVRVSESQQKATEGCKHEFTLSEEIGVICHVCGYVRSEIKHVSAPFMERRRYTSDGKPWNEDEVMDEHKPDADVGLDLSSNKAASETEAPLGEEGNNVWALIPDLKKTLHLHQKRAFEFLWRNIAGSLVPNLMESASESTGGCVVSHSPGAGKTFLMIAFLQSYLKLFPGKRPLVLAPKTTLYTWYKEFIKWEIPIPVHLIHGRRTYRVFSEQARKFRGGPRPSNDVMHVLDCLEKIQKWHARPSVLVMGYTSFLTLMREDSKFEHRRYMAKVLRESPGLLVMDEGHNPRSTKSRLRKCLMKVDTDLRVLLSGTLFQNNFCEYFNTLCLARPKFVTEVLSELDPKFRKKKNPGKAQNLLENRARKFFLDHIERKIDSDVGDERKQGLEMLKNMTNGFIDVYEGANSDGLPGLQIYTLLMNSTEVQHEILVKLHKIMAGYSGYPLELELLITLASMHPWLVKTSNCVNKFFCENDLLDLEKLKFDCKKGSKVMFVLNLVYRVVKKEKVLIFCHNIAPINLFVELFERVFRWKKGREIMVLTGDLELFERGRIMDKFEEPCSPSRVLLASITACAEGISLTAASRVIMLDSEWNPSKTKQAIARAFRPGQQKVVFVYQLLATGTLEEDKYRRTTWKEWVSNMIFSEDFVEDPSRWQAEKIEDDVLREMVAEDKFKSFHMIMKNERASTQVDKKKAQIT